MKKGITMISGPSAFGWLTRVARVQFLGLIAILSLVILPAFAKADDESAPTDLPGEAPALPVVEPSQAVDESIPLEVTVAEKINRVVKTFIEVAHSFARAPQADAPAALTDENPESTPSDVPPAEKAAATDSTTAAKPATDEPAVQPAPLSDVKAKEFEIDSIAAQIEEEKIRSAQRIAELEGQLVEAREQLTAITSTDGEGFIRSWLVLGPVRVDEKVSNHDEESNKEFLDRQYVPSRSMPKDGDKATIDDVEMGWKTIKSSDFSVDLTKVAGEEEVDTTHAAYLGVAYVTSEEEVTGVKLSIGSDDDSVWRLNGEEVIRVYGGRGVAKDQDSAEDLTLKKGVNVLSFTVLNGDGPTAAAARFVDENGQPIKGLKVSVTPPGPQITNIAPEDGNQE